MRDVLLLPGSLLNAPVGAPEAKVFRRTCMLRGALIGLATGAFARVWMRTLTDDEPVFTVFGTGLILVVFSALGASAGLALAWRRLRSPRRMLIQRGVGLAPFLFMGPFMPLFFPGLFGSLLAAFPGWPRWLRLTLWAAIALLAGFFLLVSASGGAMGIAAFAMWLPLSYLMFLALRIVFEPRPRETPSAEQADPFEPWLLPEPAF